MYLGPSNSQVLRRVSNGGVGSSIESPRSLWVESMFWTRKNFRWVAQTPHFGSQSANQLTKQRLRMGATQRAPTPQCSFEALLIHQSSLLCLTFGARAVTFSGAKTVFGPRSGYVFYADGEDQWEFWVGDGDYWCGVQGTGLRSSRSFERTRPVFGVSGPPVEQKWTELVGLYDAELRSAALACYRVGRVRGWVGFGFGRCHLVCLPPAKQQDIRFMTEASIVHMRAGAPFYTRANAWAKRANGGIKPKAQTGASLLVQQMWSWRGFESTNDDAWARSQRGCDKL